MVKHSVNLQTISVLLEHEPWLNGLQLLECHAGRGLYQPRNEPRKEQNRQNIRTLLSSRNPLLARWQWSVLKQLGFKEETIADGEWYAGSACLNAAMLSGPKHHTHFYENDSDHGVCADLESWVSRIKSSTHIYGPRDGEEAIAGQYERIDSHCVVILDPFELPASGTRLDYYRQILMAATNQAAPPALLFFYAWGSRHSPDALEFRRGKRTGKPIEALRDIIAPQAIEILWCHWRHYAMWVVVPPAIREELYRGLTMRVHEIRELLRCRMRITSRDGSFGFLARTNRLILRKFGHRQRECATLISMEVNRP